MAKAKEEEQVEKIIDAIDRIRMETCGGYYSQYVIENGKVYWADYDAGKEHAAVVLTVQPVSEFIDTYRWAIEDEDE